MLNKNRGMVIIGSLVACGGGSDMCKLIILHGWLIATSFAVRSNPRKFERKQQNYSDEISDGYFSSNVSLAPTTTNRSSKSDLIVEKFVETLMSSERYLKMVESVERKLNHLDATFQERTKSILKHLAEMLRTVKASPANSLENALTSVKHDLDKVKKALTGPQHPSMRDGHAFHAGSALDARLSFIEGNVKNIMAGVDSIVSTISEVKTRQYVRTYPKSEVGQGPLDAVGLINEFRKTIHDQKTRKCECKSGRIDRAERYPTDCHEIQVQGFNVSGIYKIKPEDIEPFYVLCDLTTAGGGWTVFQNRFDGSQDFYKSWADYKNGFGNLAGEFWLGLEKLSYLTNQKLYELRVELESVQGLEGYAAYSVFTIGPEYEGFRISTLGTYYGSAGDSLSYHAGQKFSTMDMDNDEWKDGSCSLEHGGAWWYKECDKSNLNGKYSLTPDDRGQSIYWISFKSPDSPLSKTKMMIRPLPASKPISYESNRNPLESSNLRPHGESLTAARSMEGKATHHHPYRYEEPGHDHDAFFANFS